MSSRGGERRPSRELVSLLHHVELHEEGWWDRAIEQTILAALLGGARPLSRRELERRLRSALGPDIRPGAVGRLLQDLQQDGRIVRIDRDRLKLSESTRVALERSLTDHVELERRVEARFCSLLADALTPEECARAFQLMKDRFLEPLVSELGAATWRLLMDGDLRFEYYAAGPLESFLAATAPDRRDRMRAVLATFLDPADADVRSFVLRLLSGYFFTAARTLDRLDLEVLYKQLYALDLTLVFDTPVLVGLMSVATIDDEASPGAAMLRPIFQHIRDLDVRACAAQSTIAEIRTDATAVADSLAGIASARTSSESERTQDEIRAWLRSAQPRDERDWLRRTADRLELVATSMGVDILQNPTEDDLLSARNIEADLRLVFDSGADPRAKSLEEWLHDVLLWHLVDIERISFWNILEARWWLVTDDPELLAFDRNKAELAHRHHVCVHPAALLQLLRFTRMPDDRWEASVVAMVRAPLLVQATMDDESERAALRILDGYDWWTQFGSSSTAEDALVAKFFEGNFSELGPAHEAVERARSAIRDRRTSVAGAVASAEERLLAVASSAGGAPLAAEVRSIFMDLRGAIVAVTTGGGSPVDISTSATLSPAEANAIRQLIDALRTDLHSSAGREDVPRAEIETILDRLEGEGPTPRRAIVRQTLRSLRAISESAVGSAVFTHSGAVLESLRHLM